MEKYTCKSAIITHRTFNNSHSGKTNDSDGNPTSITLQKNEPQVTSILLFQLDNESHNRIAIQPSRDVFENDPAYKRTGNIPPTLLWNGLITKVVVKSDKVRYGFLSTSAHTLL
jgi:hypothetical protein